MNNMIDMSDLNDLSLLKSHIIYASEFEELSKERQMEIYKYCKFHATFPCCKENLKQIRYAATKLYFGFERKA